ncbi:MAG: AraC family transcriptional regulator [Firmicutes bacterium]|nr:AraC family transcriptional regulator [Bacillota bacterium]
MSKMKQLLRIFPEIPDGCHESYLKGVYLFKETKHIPRKPVVYNPGICIIFQGYKVGHLNDHQFRYDEKNYLVTSVTMPIECEVFATPEEPLRGLYIDIDMNQLLDLISQTGIPANTIVEEDSDLPRAIGPAVMNEEMLDAVTRLIICLQSETESRILGSGLLREILYRVLSGTQAPVLHSIATNSCTFSRVVKVLNIMQNSYWEKLNVEQLANSAALSVSAFHRAFKEITSDSPIQYLKKIRLTKAKEFLIQEKIKASAAADKVGYESFSQFSREFKRYFGHSPAEMMKEINAG